jgi:GDP-4-dehydro-6-deoxy-D-mannose reductase
MILVTGSSGFIGSNLLHYLKEKGISCYGIDEIKGKETNCIVDMMDIGHLNTIIYFVKPDYIIHLAAQSLVSESLLHPSLTMRNNLLSTLNLCTILEGYRPCRVIFASSAAVYGQDGVVCDERSLTNPKSPYGVSKLICEQILKTLLKDVVIARFFNQSGKGKHNDALGEWIDTLKTTNKLQVGDLTTVRDYTDIRDTISAIMTLKEKGVSGETYNVCTMQTHVMSDLLNYVVAKHDGLVEIETKAPQKLRPLEEKCILGDNKKMRLLGWEPHFDVWDLIDAMR